MYVASSMTKPIFSVRWQRTAAQDHAQSHINGLATRHIINEVVFPRLDQIVKRRVGFVRLPLRELMIELE